MNDATHRDVQTPRARARRSLVAAVRCRAHNRQGQPCGRPAIRGGVVCATHGGRAPQVKRAAQERLADLIDPDRVLREAARVAYADPRMILRPDGSVLPMQEWPDAFAAAVSQIEVVQRGTEGGAPDAVFKFRTWDKPRALELLARHLGLLKDQFELSGRDGGPIKTVGVSDEELIQRVQLLLATAEGREE